MKLYVFTINYNGAIKTTNLLKSLKDQDDQDFHPVVVDNNSNKLDMDQIEDWIKSNYPSVLLIKNKENLGFTGGCNTGIKKAISNEADWIVLLNNDTAVESNFISKLKPQLDNQGIIALPLDEGNGHIAMGGRLAWLKPTLSHGHGIINTENNGNLRYAIGGGMAIHSSVIEKVGYWDESYFLYFEDADFSLRAIKRDVPIKFLGEPIVHHTGSASTKLLGGPMLLRYHYRNALYFNFKNGPLWIMILVWPWSWMIILKQAIKIILRYKVSESDSILMGVLDFYSKRMGKIKGPVLEDGSQSERAGLPQER